MPKVKNMSITFPNKLCVLRQLDLLGRLSPEGVAHVSLQPIFARIVGAPTVI